jgi:hypothetical protein
MTTAKDDFDIAKEVSDLLKDIDKPRQQRILRWVFERLELEAQPPQAPAAPAPAAHPPSSPPAHAPAGRAKDIKSFIGDKKPKNDVHFATAVAYYYRFEAPSTARKESISAETLLDAARLADFERPSAPRNVLNNAKKRGYLNSTERGLFEINSVGENLVAMSMPSAAIGEPEVGTRRRRARR